MASDEHGADRTDSGHRAGDQQPADERLLHGQGDGETVPSPPSWPRSLAPLAIIFAFSLAIVLAILAMT